ncbi:MAG: hypothetical protein HY098_02350 [Nitrospinae bacterium]|nr:hypothetical protein [Nitrospinota bacterium]
MKKSLTLSLFAAFVLVGAYFAPKAEAVPAFARQISQPCFACHYQHIPNLNGFGRTFKLGGYTQTTQDTIKDEGLSLSPNVGAAFVMKYRFQQETAKGGNPAVPTGAQRGEWDIHDEAAIWMAGRLSDNFGMAVEMPGPTVSSKIIYSQDFGGIQGGISAYGTDAAGPGWGMELWNTCGVANIKGWEVAGFTCAQRALGSGTGATGLSVFAGSSLFFANVGLYGPASTNIGGTATGAGNISSIDTGFNLAVYYRLAVTPQIGGADLMVGVQGTTGKTKLTGGLGAGELEVTSDTLAVDAQLQGDLAGMPLQVVFAYQTNGKDNSKIVTTADGNDITGTAGMLNGARDANAMSIGAELGFNKMFGIKAAYLTMTQKGATDVSANYTSVGAYFNPVQNVSINPEYVIGSGDGREIDSKLMIMAMFGF